MIPMAGVLAFRVSPQGRRWWIPLPLFLLWLILLPLAVVWVPVVFITCLVLEIDPVGVFAVTWQLLAGLRNLRVQFDQKDASVRILFI
ncbi:MAG TPA: hypothetical protein VMU49_10025 [Candidatus Acidoferrales bacterium]|nr:hypothetical protein [Candidatus Acidoferrales bacterium]